MVETSAREDAGWRYAAVGVALGLIALAVFAMQWLQTGLFELVILGFVALVALAPAAWVFGDAGARGLPRVPWTVVALFLPVLGLGLYLVTRAVKASA